MWGEKREKKTKMEKKKKKEGESSLEMVALNEGMVLRPVFHTRKEKTKKKDDT